MTGEKRSIARAPAVDERRQSASRRTPSEQRLLLSPHRAGADFRGAERLEGHPRTKLHKRILDLIPVETPLDPNAAEFQLGNTLGAGDRHWRRAKFLDRFRLFFRFSSGGRAIVYAWVNDETTLRKAGSKSDPYAAFTKRLREGNPPDRWEDLFREVHAPRLRLDPE